MFICVLYIDCVENIICHIIPQKNIELSASDIFILETELTNLKKQYDTDYSSILIFYDEEEYLEYLEYDFQFRVTSEHKLKISPFIKKII